MAKLEEKLDFVATMTKSALSLYQKIISTSNSIYMPSFMLSSPNAQFIPLTAGLLVLFLFLKESKGPAVQENVVQENITSTHPAIVMSEIPLENIFDDIASKDVEVFVEKGSNDAETKEAKPSGATTSTTIVTTSRTVVKSDGSPVTTVEKKVVVNGEEQPVDTNLLSPPVEPEVVDEKAEEGSEESGDKGEAGEKEEAEGNEGGKPRQKVKKKKSFKKTFQGMMHRRSKADKDEDEEKS